MPLVRIDQVPSVILLVPLKAKAAALNPVNPLPAVMMVKLVEVAEFQLVVALVSIEMVIRSLEVPLKVMPPEEAIRSLTEPWRFQR